MASDDHAIRDTSGGAAGDAAGGTAGDTAGDAVGDAAGGAAGDAGPRRRLDRVARIQREWARERPDVDVRPQGVIGRLHRLGGLLTRELETVFERHGISHGEFDVLAALRRAGEPYERAPGELARFTMITSGAITKRVDRLEQAGLVARRRSVDDGRGRVVGLTPAGLRLVDAAFTDHMRNEHRLLAALSPADADDLERLLTTWLAAVEPPADDP